MQSVPEESLPPVSGTCLVTGGAGFVGSHLVASLLQLGAEVTVMDNFSYGSRHRMESMAKGHEERLHLLSGSLESLEDCVEACQDIHTVFHYASTGNSPSSFEEPFSSCQANVEGSLNLLWAAWKQGVHKFVQASSSSVYGDDSSIPMVEDRTGRPQSPYALSRYVAELYGDLFWRKYHLPTITLRYFNVYGPGQLWAEQGPAVVTCMLSYLLQGQSPPIYGNGEQSRDFVYIDDAVSANFLAAASRRGGVYNVGSGERYTINEIYEECLSVLKNLGQKIIAPPPHYLPQRFGEVNHGLAHMGRASQELGYKPTITMSEGLHRTASWLLSLSQDERDLIYAHYLDAIATPWGREANE
ncbi:NAD-dependent epimerase/dehydratase family protein [Desulfurispira natronophila]|uniref:Nucleoside-diphosphate-sugar epimerase n=1 Tax=Desulfurispira natronophila TaxID=682562 RepID=A0A7W7Y3F8_9BACT|nr:NAD-dependent epimerase/dehydratase family protein [Desulfurispira natronophila]MBB5021117.1 nucleoside-diphosphate-sugar epimerase [Desulfurispira natronophila]